MRAFLLIVFALLANACSSGDDEHALTLHAPIGDVASAHANTAPAPASPSIAESTADAERGRALVVTFECNRCHDGTGHPAMATEKHCTHCHEDIETGRFGAGTPKIAEWRRSVAPYRYAPSLEAAGKRLRPDFIEAYLQSPFDLRPNLAASMPRLALSRQQAVDVAAYLTRDAPIPRMMQVLDEARLGLGRELVEAKGCGGCHAFTGVPPLGLVPDLKHANDARRKAIQLAPDLRYTRDRFRQDALVDWLMSPASLKPDTLMPNHALSPADADDIATYLVRATLSPLEARAKTPRLPLLTRAVGYREVEERVLSVTCRHCHGDPDVAGGDGGPGNTGGFGFSPRGLDLSTYRSAAAGIIGHDGQRHSLFEKMPDGTPLLVAALDARRSEEAGQAVVGVRGMPLGLPAVSAEDVQLVETWIAQGRRK